MARTRARLKQAIRACFHVALFCLGTLGAKAAPAPTVVLNIHSIGAERLAALKSHPDVLWSAEFGNELLLAIEPDQYSAWLARRDARPGLPALRREELLIRDHACWHQSAQAADLVVGGYELLRQPASAIAYQIRAGAPVQTLPADGVVTRELANELTPMAPDAERPEVLSVVNRVDADRWFETMSALAAFNRNSFSAQLLTSRDWILSQFQGAGLSTSVFPFTLEGGSCNPAPPPVTISNPIGFKQGSTLPDEWIVVGAHYDSRNVNRCDGSAAPQPGANDNASGCAGVIELARVFSRINTERSMVFTCFAGEEQGLVGSRRYVEALQASGEISKVKHMINLDMIGFAVDDSLAARIDTRAVFSSWLDVYAAAAQTYAPELSLIRGTNAAANSDHWYFMQAGIPGMFTWENGAAIYPHYHRDTDLPQNMTRARPLANGILKMDTAVLVGLVGLASPPGQLFANGFEALAFGHESADR